jgi:hypothetical protein
LPLSWERDEEGEFYFMIETPQPGYLEQKNKYH